MSTDTTEPENESKATQFTKGPLMAIGGYVTTVNEGKRVTVATCHNHFCTEDEAGANALLYAAAPELLEALRSFSVYDAGASVRCFCSKSERVRDHDGNHSPRCIAARAAIAKATKGAK